MSWETTYKNYLRLVECDLCQVDFAKVSSLDKKFRYTLWISIDYEPMNLNWIVEINEDEGILIDDKETPDAYMLAVVGLVKTGYLDEYATELYLSLKDYSKDSFYEIVEVNFDKFSIKAAKDYIDEFNKVNP